MAMTFDLMNRKIHKYEFNVAIQFIAYVPGASVFHKLVWFRGYSCKTLFMLNTTEHEIYHAHEC